MTIDWEAISKGKELKKKAESIRRDKRAKIILHPVIIIVFKSLSIAFAIINIIYFYSLFGLKIALAITFIGLLAVIVFFILHKPDEEA